MNKFYLSCLFTFLATFSFSQTHNCGVGIEEGELIMERLIENKKILAKKGFTKSDDFVYIPVKFNILAENDGTGQLPFEAVLEELCYLNTEFEDVGFKFYLKDGRPNYYYTTTYYNAPGSSAGISYMRARKDPNAVNIFIANNAGDRPDITVLGFYSPSSDLIVIRKANFATGDHTVTHEVGHFFSLNHTFYGWEFGGGSGWNPDEHGTIVSQTQINGFPIELVDKSNCNLGGDGICDTAPNYLFGLSYPNSCPPFNLEVYDRNEEKVIPDVNNYMSYFNGCDPYNFSNDQMAIMNTDFNRNSRSYLRSSYVPFDVEISEQVQIYSPANNTVVSGYNEVILDWSDVENAQSYSISVSGGGERFEYKTENSWILVEDLNPGRFYSWKVIPWNEVGGCGTSASRLFRTPTVTSTSEDLILNTFTVSPNPVTRDSEINVYLNSKITGSANLEVISIAGQKISNQKVSLTQGENQLKIANQNKAGIYLVKLTTNAGSAVRKIIVN